MSARRVFVTVLLGTLLAQAAWILVLPPFRGIDEFDHVFKAAAVARGQWTSHGDAADGRGGLVRIPGDIVTAASAVCRSYTYTGRDNCVAVRHYPGGDVDIATAASAYNPAYYLVVGTLARPFKGVGVDYAMRAVTALACALMLAWSASIVGRWGPSRWPLVCFYLGLTPVLVYSTAIASPNGVAYSGAALLWTSILSTVRTPGTAAKGLAGAAVGGVALATTHPTGPMFVFLIVASAFLLRPISAWSRDIARRPSRWVAAALPVLVAAAASVVWLAHSHSIAEGEPTAAPSWTDYLVFHALWVLESIAVFPTLNEYPPTVVYALWGVPLLVLVAGLFRMARRREALTALALLGLLLVIPTAFTAATYRNDGLVWQGRYSLPLWLGISSITALLASLRRERLPGLVPVVYLLAAGATVVSLVYVGQQDLAPGATAPVASQVPAGVLIAAGLGAVGILLPLLATDRTRRASSDVEATEATPADGGS